MGGCVVIPVYDNAGTIASVVRDALGQASTVLVCDDGATDGSGDRAAEAGAHLIRLARNSGKGVALRALFAEASRRGFHYAFAMDGDGQHRAADLPSLVAAVEADRGALVIGERDFDAAGAPKASRFGRRFSNFWMWFESGVRIPDTQSGLRAYPVTETRRLGGWGRRYEFEVEILLRAAWAGLPIRSVKVGTVYPADRVSHFRKLHDNVRISVLNTLACVRLLVPWPLGPRVGEVPARPGASLYWIRRWYWLGAGGAFRRLAAAVAGVWAGFAAGETRSDPADALLLSWLPILALLILGAGLLPIAAAAAAALLLPLSGWALAGIVSAALALAFAERVAHRPGRVAASWSGRSRGGVWGYWFFLKVTKLFGRRFAYAWLYPVVGYFVLAAPRARQVSADFFEAAVGPARGLVRLARAYRHFLTFARCLVDRAVLVARGPKEFRCTHEGIEHIRAVSQAGAGGILLSAHLGNWEIGPGLLRDLFSIRVAVVAFRGEEERLRKLLAHLEAAMRPRILPVGEDALASLEILRALREGWLVAIQGDRLLDERAVRVPFLGRAALFPAGPFILAAVSGAPLIQTFALKAGPDAYRFIADPPVHLRFDKDRERMEQIAEWATRYARRLESLARAHPDQWFNFYDFWNARPPAPP